MQKIVDAKTGRHQGGVYVFNFLRSVSNLFPRKFQVNSSHLHHPETFFLFCIRIIVIGRLACVFKITDQVKIRDVTQCKTTYNTTAKTLQLEAMLFVFGFNPKQTFRLAVKGRFTAAFRGTTKFQNLNENLKIYSWIENFRDRATLNL